MGLGPGSADLLTRQAWQILESVPEVYLRTRQHPAVAGFPSQLNVHSFDELYENGENFEAVYAQIVERVLTLAHRPEGVVYAVPGHPLVAETSSLEVLMPGTTGILNITLAPFPSKYSALDRMDALSFPVYRL